MKGRFVLARRRIRGFLAQFTTVRIRAWASAFVFLLMVSWCPSLQAAPGDKKWEFTFGGFIDNIGSPALTTNGDVLVGCYDGKLYCITPQGTERWSFATSQIISANPLVRPDGTIYFGADKLYILNADGSLRQAIPLPPYTQPVGVWTPLIGPDGTIYVAGANAQLCAIRPDGGIRWAVNDGAILAVEPDGTLLRCDGNIIGMHPDGVDVWSQSLDMAFSSPLAVSSSGQIVVGLNGTPTGAVELLDAQANLVWQYVGDGQCIGGPIIGPDGAVYEGFDSGTVVALETNGQLRWQNAIVGSNGTSQIYGTPALAADGTLYVTANRWLHALDPNGRVVWRCDAGSNYLLLSPVIGSDGTVYFGAIEGQNPSKLVAVEGTGAPLAAGQWPMLMRDTGHSGSTCSNVLPPSAPTNLTATLGDFTDKVVFRWNSAAWATSYRLFRGPTPNATDALPLAEGITGTVSFEDRSALPGLTNYYFVQSSNSVAQSAWVGPVAGYRRPALVGEPAWIFPTGAGTPSVPGIANDGTVVFASSDAKVYALTPDGQPKWMFQAPGQIATDPSIGDDGTIYFVGATGQFDTNKVEAVYALFALTSEGNLKWTQNIFGFLPNDVAIAADGTVFVSCEAYSGHEAVDGGILAINPDGTRRWTFQDNRGYSGAPTIAADGTVYVGTRDGMVHAFNPDGTSLWELQLNDGWLGRIIIDATGVLWIGGSDIWAVNPDAQIRGDQAVGSSSPGPSCIDSAGIIYDLGWGGFFALYTNDTVEWTIVEGGPGSEVVPGSNGLVYAATSFFSSAKLTAVSNATEIWNVPLPECAPATMAATNLIYLGGSDGNLYAVRTESGLASSAWPEARHDPQRTGRARQLPPLPISPDPLAATVRTRITDVRLTWQSVIGASRYQVFRYQSSNLTDAVLIGSVAGNISFDDKTATPETAYYYWVRATNGSGVGPFSAVASGTRRQAVPGAQLYEYDLQGPVNSAPVIGNDGTVYVAVGAFRQYGIDYGNQLAALSPDGTIKWTTSLNGPTSSSPTLAPDGTIYVGYNNGLSAFHPDGTMRWDFPTASQVVATPAIGADGTLYFATLRSEVFALTPDAQVLWTNSLGTLIDASPSIGRDGAIYFPARNGQLYSFSPDGTLRWNTYWGSQVDSETQPSSAIGSDGTIYVKGRAIYPDGSTAWVNTTSGPTGTPILDSSGTLYISCGGSFSAFGPGGTNLWTATIGGYPDYDIVAAALSDSGFLYVTCTTGLVVGLSTNGTQVWSLPLTAGSYSSPAIAADGTIYLGTMDRKVISIFGNGPLASSPWPMFQRDLAHGARDTNTPGLPAIPTNITASGGTFNDRVRVTWTNAFDAWFYQVWRSPTTNAADGAQLAVHVTTSNSFDDLYPPEGVTNFYLVRSGNSLGYSAFSVAASGFRRIAVPGEIVGQIQASGGAVLPATDNTNGIIYLAEGTYLNALRTNLSAVWTYNTSNYTYSLSGPTVGADGTIYMTFGGGYSLRAVNPDGSSRWVAVTSNSDASFTTIQPSISTDDTIYVAVEFPSAICAFSPSGAEIWRTPLDSAPATPIAIGNDGTLYLGGGLQYLYAISPSGVLLWKFPAGSVVAPPAIGPDAAIYFGTQSGAFYALTPLGAKKWKYQATSGVFSASPVIGPTGNIYIGGTDGSFYNFNQGGALQWVYKAAGAINAAAVVAADNTVIFGAGSGNLYALNPDGTSAWQNSGNLRSVYYLTMLNDGNLVALGGGNLFLLRTGKTRTDLHWPTAQHDPQRTGRVPPSWVQPGLSPSQSMYPGETLSAAPTLSLGGRTIVLAELVVGTNVVSVATNAPFNLSWTPLQAGTNQVFVMLVDNLGCVYSSAPISVAASPLIMNLQIDSSGQLNLEAAPIPGHQYVLEVTTDLINWSDVTAPVTNSGGQIIWSVGGTTNSAGLEAFRVRATH